MEQTALCLYLFSSITTVSWVELHATNFLFPDIVYDCFSQFTEDGWIHKRSVGESILVNSILLNFQPEAVFFHVGPLSSLTKELVFMYTGILKYFGAKRKYANLRVNFQISE